MQDDRDSTDSQETVVTQSWLYSEHPHQVEDEEEDQEPYEWDSFQEEPSYLDQSVSSPQIAVQLERDTRRQSSTSDNLLEVPPSQVVQPFIFSRELAEPYATWPPRNPSSEPEFFAEDLLPAGLLDTVNEFEEEKTCFSILI